VTTWQSRARGSTRSGLAWTHPSPGRAHCRPWYCGGPFGQDRSGRGFGIDRIGLPRRRRVEPI